jgi:sulfonate transport system substrate-binding protein
VTASAALVAGCASSTSGAASSGSTTGSLSGVTLRVGVQTAGDEALLQASGELTNLPYKISWTSFTSGPPLLQGIEAGSIDIGAVGDAPPVFAAAGGAKLKIVSAVKQTDAAAGIVVPKGSSITSVAQLKGKTVAVAQGSSADYDLLAQLKKAGLSWSDIHVIYLQPAAALAAFSSGNVDAWDIWDPYITEAEQKLGATQFVNGTGVDNGLSFEVAADSSLQDSTKRAAITDYVKRIHLAYLWAESHTAAWSKVRAQLTGMSYATVLAAAQKDGGVPIAINSSVIASEQAVADAFATAGLIPKDPALSDFFDTSVAATAATATASGS